MTSLDSLRQLDVRVRALVERLQKAESANARLEKTLAERERELGDIRAELDRLKSSRRAVRHRVDELLGKLDAMDLDLG